MKYRNKYSIQFKLKSIELVNILGIYRTSIILGIDKKCIKNWYFQRYNFQKIIKANCSYRLPGAGKKVKYPKKEEELMYFIIKCKEIGIFLNSNLIIEEYCRICPDVNKNSNSSLRKWYYRFLKRYNYSLEDFKNNKNKK